MIAAALLGDALAFRSGRRYGPRLRAGRWGSRVGDERWAQGRRACSTASAGGACSAPGGWRSSAPSCPGWPARAGMPYRRFAPWNAAGVVTWVGGVGRRRLPGRRVVRDGLQLPRQGDRRGARPARCDRGDRAGRALARAATPTRRGRWRRGPRRCRRALADAAVRRAVLPAVHAASAPGWALLLNLGAGLALLFVVGLGAGLGDDARSCAPAGCPSSTTRSRRGSPSGAPTDVVDAGASARSRRCAARS